MFMGDVSKSKTNMARAKDDMLRLMLLLDDIAQGVVLSRETMFLVQDRMGPEPLTPDAVQGAIRGLRAAIGFVNVWMPSR